MMSLEAVLYRAVQEIKMKLFNYSLILIFLLSLAGCVKDETQDPLDDSSREYFPLLIGKYITYAVDSIVIDDSPTGNIKDTIQFLLKEEITDIQLTNGDTVYYIHRFRRDSTESWRLTDVWTAKYAGNEVLRTEENLTFRKMVFPLNDRKKWIATSYINPATKILVGTENIQAFQYWEAQVIEFDIADEVGSFSFNDGEIMHIIQTDSDDGSSQRYVFEKYARGIGLVQRTDTILDSKCLDLPDITPCLGIPLLEHANKGYILSQIMIDHN